MTFELKHPFPTIERNLKAHEVYEYYDRPILWLGVWESYQFLVMLATDDRDTDYEAWLYAPVDDERLAQLLSCEMDLRTAFTQPLGGVLFYKSLTPSNDTVPHQFKFITGNIEDSHLANESICDAGICLKG